MPRRTRRQRQKKQTRKQKGGLHLLRGQLVKIKPEHFEAFKKSLKVERETFPKYPAAEKEFLINPDDTYIVLFLGMSGNTKNTIMTFIARNPFEGEQTFDRPFVFERIYIPKEMVIPLPFNNRVELEPIPAGTLVDTFADLSTAQSLALQGKRFRVDKYSCDNFNMCFIIEEGIDSSSNNSSNYNDKIRIFRNQIVMPEDPIAFVPKSNTLRKEYAQFSRLPNIKLSEEYLAPFEALARRENDEMIRFRAFQQHKGNCWSDSFFAILFEASALKEYVLPVILKLVAFEQKTYGTTLLAADPTILPAMASFMRQQYNLGGIPDITLLFFMNGFQRYINKIVQYMELQKRSAAGASLAPTASLNTETAEEYQICFHPKTLLPPRPGSSMRATGGSFVRDLEKPTVVFLNAIAPNVFTLFAPIKLGEKQQIIGYKPLPAIPEAYYFAISSESTESGGAANAAKDHRNHVVSMYRKIGLPELPEGIWYFYDDNYGVYKIPLEESNKLNSVGLAKLGFSTEEQTWTVQLHRVAALSEEQSSFKMPFGRYRFNFYTRFIHAFIKKEEE
jgi:hypothetical protein